MQYQKSHITKGLAIISSIAVLYGSLNTLVPGISAGTYVSISFIIVSAIGITFCLTGIAKNPYRIRVSTINGQEIKEAVYSRKKVYLARIAFAFTIVFCLAAIYMNLKIKGNRRVHFTTENVTIDSCLIKIHFNMSNPTSDKFLITSMGIISYEQGSSCRYFAHDRYGLSLALDSNCYQTISYEMDDNNFIPFDLKITYKAFSCTTEIFGIYFICNDLSGNLIKVKSDAIYILDADESDDYKKSSISFFTPSRSDNQYYKSGDDSVISQRKQSVDSYKKYMVIYNKHVESK